MPGVALSVGTGRRRTRRAFAPGTRRGRMTRIAAISGSRRAESTTRAALRVALDAAADAGVETDLIDLAVVDLPLYHPDEDKQGDSEALKRRVREADGVLAGTPVYHGSYSSTFN